MSQCHGRECPAVSRENWLSHESWCYYGAPYPGGPGVETIERICQIANLIWAIWRRVTCRFCTSYRLQIADFPWRSTTTSRALRILFSHCISPVGIPTLVPGYPGTAEREISA
eukprot:3106581-Rhodomonas_salina.1